MALTKAGLKEILSKAGTPTENIAEAVEGILDGHVTSINALREEITTYKADAEKLPSVQKELDTLKATNSNEWETKYNAEHEAFEQYKGKVEAEKALTTKKALYTNLLKEQHVDEKRLASILKVTDFDSMTVKDGQLANIDKLTEAIKADWSGFIISEHVDGADVDNPPNNTSKVTKADYEKMSLSKQMEFANSHADMVAAFYKE
nr:MAG TPA: minor structural protein [Caudoviricetes sp.]